MVQIWMMLQIKRLRSNQPKKWIAREPTDIYQERGIPKKAMPKLTQAPSRIGLCIPLFAMTAQQAWQVVDPIKGVVHCRTEGCCKFRDQRKINQGIGPQKNKRTGDLPSTTSTEIGEYLEES
jgi:hypothetical protein